MKRFFDWVERNEQTALGATVLLVFLALLIAFYGCGGRPEVTESPQQSGPSPDGTAGLGAVIGSTGSTILYIGAWACGLGLVARFAGFVVPVLAPFQSIAGDIAELGAIAAIVGGLFVWIAPYGGWILGLSCAAAGLAWCYTRRATLRRWLFPVTNRIASIRKETP